MVFKSFTFEIGRVRGFPFRRDLLRGPHGISHFLKGFPFEGKSKRNFPIGATFYGNPPLEIHTPCEWLRSRFSNDPCQNFKKNMTLLWLKINNFEGISSQDPYESIQHVKISILTKYQPPTPKLWPLNSPNTHSISVDLARPLHRQFKNQGIGPSNP